MSGMTPDQLGELIDRHGAALELYAAQWTRSPADTVQEAFIELIRLDVLPEWIVPWLYRVVRNRAMNAGRSEARRRRHEQHAAPRTDWFDPASAEKVEATEAAELLLELTCEQREVIVARIWGQLSFEQIAELTESSVSTAYRRFQAGLETLKARLTRRWLTNEIT